MTESEFGMCILCRQAAVVELNQTPMCLEHFGQAMARIGELIHD